LEHIMAKPPPSGPHSDITSVNRDARAGTASKSDDPNPGAAINNAKDDATARPEESAPEGGA
jgi:hypothetical protein